MTNSGDSYRTGVAEADALVGISTRHLVLPILRVSLCGKRIRQEDMDKPNYTPMKADECPRCNKIIKDRL